MSPSSSSGTGGGGGSGSSGSDSGSGSSGSGSDSGSGSGSCSCSCSCSGGSNNNISSSNKLTTIIVVITQFRRCYLDCSERLMCVISTYKQRCLKLTVETVNVDAYGCKHGCGICTVQLSCIYAFSAFYFNFWFT